MRGIDFFYIKSLTEKNSIAFLCGMKFMFEMIYLPKQATNFHSYHLQRYFFLLFDLHSFMSARNTMQKKQPSSFLTLLSFSLHTHRHAFILNTCKAKKCIFCKYIHAHISHLILQFFFFLFLKL